MKVLWFDTETTGLDAVKNDIVQLAGMIEIDGVIMEEFEIRMQPRSYENVSEEALRIQKTTIDQIKTYQTPDEAYKKISGILSKYIDRYNKADKFYPAGQNVGFDRNFLDQFYKKSGDGYFYAFVNNYALDLLQLTSILRYQGLLTTENLKLSTIANACGIDASGAHTAIDDIKMTRKCFKHLTSKFMVEPSEKSDEQKELENNALPIL